MQDKRTANLHTTDRNSQKGHNFVLYLDDADQQPGSSLYYVNGRGYQLFPLQYEIQVDSFFFL